MNAEPLRPYPSHVFLMQHCYGDAHDWPFDSIPGCPHAIPTTQIISFRHRSRRARALVVEVRAIKFTDFRTLLIDPKSVRR